MAFLEFGFAALRYEVCWLPVALIRSLVLDTVVGGLSCALRFLLRSMCLHDGGNFVDGVILPLDEGPTFLFAEFRTHLGDEAALSRGLSCKGASGMRPCTKCANVLKKDSDVTSPHIVEIDCIECQQFVANTDEEIWRQWDQL